MPTGEDPAIQDRAARFFPPWQRDSLPDPPRLTARSWTLLIGPGLLMAGSNIGGGEWLFGPIVTARYGGSLMWLATLSIAFQVSYNLSVMRYTLYTGEPIFVGFFRTAPGQVSDVDGIIRRWTDVIWTGHKGARNLEGGQVRYVYYGIMRVYGLWGLLALRLTPDPLVLAVVTGVPRNIGLGASSLHALYINRKLLPAELRPPLLLQAGLVGSFLFFTGISGIVFNQQLHSLLGSRS